MISVASAVSSNQRPVFDVGVAFPELARLRDATAGGDWQAVSNFFGHLADEDDRSFAAGVVSGVPGAEIFLSEVASREVSFTLPRVLLAKRYISMASEARTARRAKYVSRQQFAVFHDHLRSAEQLLIEVTAREPANGMAWALRLPTAMGLELGQSEARRRYDRLAMHNPHHFIAQGSLLQQLCPKWGGSWDAMHGFARACLLAAPPGRLSGVLIAEGHLEHWLDLGGATRTDSVKYLRQPHIHREIIEAAEASVLNPAFRPCYAHVSAHGVFAMAFSQIGDYPRAAVHFRALGNVASDYPWSYFGDKVAAFERHRAIALAKG